MKVATTVQITPEEDREISLLQKEMGFGSKRQVVREGLKALRRVIQAEQRRRRLKKASLLVRKESRTLNREWAPRSTAVTIDED